MAKAFSIISQKKINFNSMTEISTKMNRHRKTKTWEYASDFVYKIPSKMIGPKRKYRKK